MDLAVSAERENPRAGGKGERSRAVSAN